jgi:hypothetical protein
MATINGFVAPPLDMARRDLREATEAMAAYWGRSTFDTDSQMTDVRSAVEALTRAVSSVALAVERVSNETAGLLNRELDRN